MSSSVCRFFLFISDYCVSVICILTDLLGCVLIACDCLLCGAYFYGNVCFSCFYKQIVFFFCFSIVLIIMVIIYLLKIF